MLLLQTSLRISCLPYRLWDSSRHTVDITSYTPRITSAVTPRWNVGISPFTQRIQNNALILNSDQGISHDIESFRGVGGAPVIACRSWVCEAWTSAVRVDAGIVAVGNTGVVFIIPLGGVVAIVIFEIYTISSVGSVHSVCR